MIENLQDELYQLENKQAKSSKPCANIRSWMPQTFFKVLERQNVQNQTLFELYTDDSKSKYSSNIKDILKSAKKIMKISTSSELPQLLINFRVMMVLQQNFINTFQMNSCPFRCL